MANSSHYSTHPHDSSARLKPAFLIDSLMLQTYGERRGVVGNRMTLFHGAHSSNHSLPHSSGHTKCSSVLIINVIQMEQKSTFDSLMALISKTSISFSKCVKRPSLDAIVLISALATSLLKSDCRLLLLLS